MEFGNWLRSEGGWRIDKALTLIFGFTSILLVSACVFADGPYYGRVFEKDTKKPIEGAAVLAVWWKRTAMIGHPMESVHDAQEAQTDAEGNFTILGTSTFSLNPLTRIDEPTFTIFKPKYRAYSGLLTPVVEGIATGVYEKDKKMIVELEELKTVQERLENLRRIFISSDVSPQKYPYFMKLRNIEEDNLGLPPRQTPVVTK